jgi:ribonuclease HIII
VATRDDEINSSIPRKWGRRTVVYRPRFSTQKTFLISGDFLRIMGRQISCPSISTKQDGSVTPLTSHTCKLTPAQAKSLEVYLRDHDFAPKTVPYARFAGVRPDVNVVFYESGKLVVQGKGTQEFVEFVLEPLILQEAKIGYEEQLNPELLEPRIGVDESGKGDFFGPLCVAGVYVNADVIHQWKTAGVRDSKAIGSDRKINEIAKVIRSTKGCVYTVVPIGNEAYNRLYAKMNSVNSILAWGHARVIENLLALAPRMVPPPLRAISDQFAHSKDVVQKAMMALGRDLELVQRHKAEADIAVAAASILARDEFVTRLHRLGIDCGVHLPKGASTEVEDAAREFIEKHGAKNLGKIAKMHFRTSYRVQGLPEPPKKEWKRPAKSTKSSTL